MRRRFQNGSLLQRGGSWVAQWWEDGHRRKRFLGLVAEMSKTAARREVSKIVSPINARETPPGQGWEFCHFVDRVYLSFYRRKWKRSTAVTNEERINYHLIPAFGNSTLGSFDREGLQEFLDRKAAAGLSFSTIDHLRWDLKQMFDMRWQRVSCCAIPHNSSSPRENALAPTRKR